MVTTTQKSKAAQIRDLRKGIIALEADLDAIEGDDKEAKARRSTIRKELKLNRDMLAELTGPNTPTGDGEVEIVEETKPQPKGKGTEKPAPKPEAEKPQPKTESVDELEAKLKASTDGKEKRALRRKLRKLRGVIRPRNGEGKAKQPSLKAQRTGLIDRLRHILPSTAGTSNGAKEARSQMAKLLDELAELEGMAVAE